jgi:hypothetical protein
MKHLVQLFVDGSDVDFNQMLAQGLIEQKFDGYVLTAFGKSFLHKE